MRALQTGTRVKRVPRDRKEIQQFSLFSSRYLNITLNINIRVSLLFSSSSNNLRSIYLFSNKPLNIFDITAFQYYPTLTFL